MIGVVFGTTGELIKLAPVLLRLGELGHRPLLMTTAQQVEQIPSFLRDFDLPDPDVWLARGFRGGDLERTQEIPVWAAQVAVTALRRRGELAARLRSDGRPPVLLVHGDTMTTVLGSLIARLLRVPVGHIEAGMRSGDWRNPFPEELNRRMAAKLATIHFAPGPQAVANLRAESVRGSIVDTVQNTIRDAVDLAAARGSGEVAVPDEPFGIVSLHRYELIERPDRFRPVLEILREHSRRQPLLFVDHSTTAAALRAGRLEGFFDERFRRVPRQRYFPFISLLKESAFLVTDSGGSQEECAFLGLPCLIHRAVSEHQTGLGGCVVLSGMDVDVLRAFLADPDRLRTPAPEAEAHPTDLILAELARIGAVAAPRPEVPVDA